LALCGGLRSLQAFTSADPISDLKVRVEFIFEIVFASFEQAGDPAHDRSFSGSIIAPMARTRVCQRLWSERSCSFPSAVIL
jgi:hypothetical protein